MWAEMIIFQAQNAARALSLIVINIKIRLSKSLTGDHVNKTKTLLGFAIAAILFTAATSCQKAGNQNTPANQPDKQPRRTRTKTPIPPRRPIRRQAPTGTPTDAYKAAYTARKNKDIDGLKKVLSKDILEFFTMMGDADDKNKKSLDDMLRELCDRPQAATAEARNEKIDGDKATIEYLDETGGWGSMDFVKEDGVWKLTIDKADKPSSDDKPRSKEKQEIGSL